jgi:thiol-disulfide isomerase/thioredoxin
MRKTKQNIESLQEFAENKDGKLVSIKYINSYTKMSWECKEKHQWEANWNNVHQGSWCPYCARKAKPDIIESLQEFAENKDGKLISTEYINNKENLIWECKEGHQWKACWNNIKNLNQWCPTCFGNSKPVIEELQEYAENKGGKLISTEYINARTRMKWKCKEGHQWEACWYNIKNAGQWCPECASFKTEYKCKELLEQTFGFEFKKTRFYYANNNKHKYFEFDGYNEDHKIAFEYHGYQHYIFPNFFQKTLEIHENAKQRDMDKVIYAKENNIKLIIIPYTEEKNLESYIKEINNG